MKHSAAVARGGGGRNAPSQVRTLQTLKHSELQFRTNGKWPELMRARVAPMVGVKDRRVRIRVERRKARRLARLVTFEFSFHAPRTPVYMQT